VTLVSEVSNIVNAAKWPGGIDHRTGAVAREQLLDAINSAVKEGRP
jgi:hypothetical protein